MASISRRQDHWRARPGEDFLWQSMQALPSSSPQLPGSSVTLAAHAAGHAATTKTMIAAKVQKVGVSLGRIDIVLPVSPKDAVTSLSVENDSPETATEKPGFTDTALCAIVSR